jgi:hypothetical protein
MVSESEEKNGGYSCASEEWTGLTKLMGLIISELIRKKCGRINFRNFKRGILKRGE